MITIDVGGTFTDVVAVDDKGNLTTTKIATNPAHMEAPVIEGAKRLGVKGHDMLNHASTAGLNAILTRNLPKIGFLTTLGHRDILDAARAWRPLDAQTDPDWRRPGGDAGGRPLVERYLRRGIKERIRSNGEVLIPFDEDQARQEIELLKRCQVKGVAICLINAYVNGVHERMLREMVKAILGEHTPISISSEVSPLAKEYARASTTVMDVYMKIVFGDYLNRVAKGLEQINFEGSLNISDSAAMLLPYQFAMDKPSKIMYSGPAAGTMSCAYLGDLLGQKEIICCDVGGTSTDISVVSRGQPIVKTIFDLEHDVVVNTLANEIFSIGQGGGTMAHVSPFGELLVGPESAGADPGPACYGKGGTKPTITDACLLIGILDAKKFLGGEQPLNPDLSRQAFEALPIKADLGTKVKQVYELGLNNTAEGILGVTIERGIDPREYVMYAYGSAGPMLIPQIMDRIGVPKIVVPPNPGLFSALGLACTDLVYSDSKSAYIMLAPDAGIAGQIETVFTEMEEQLAHNLTPEQKGKVQFVRSFDGWYAGQTWETPFVPVPSGHLTAESIGQMISDFHTHYARMWGSSFPFMPVVAITYRTRLLLPTQKLNYKPLARRDSGAAVGVKKQLSFLPDKESLIMEYERGDLYFGDVIQGPAIIREPMSTTMVCLGQVARIGQYGEIQVERRS